MILPKADPETAIKQLRQLRMRFGFSEEKMLIIDNAISCINRMQMREAELMSMLNEAGVNIDE